MNLIPEYERVVLEARVEWFVMENVKQAPQPSIDGYHVRAALLNNRWLGEVQNRVRRFSFGTRDGAPLVLDGECVALHNIDRAPTVLASGSQWKPGYRSPGNGRRKSGGVWGFKTEAFYREARTLQGLPDDFLAHAPFTVREKIRVIGNGVPLPMGRAVARAVKRALGLDAPAPSRAQGSENG